MKSINKPALDRELTFSNELEEMRIDMLIDVGLCCKEEYADYLGNIINQQFKELKARLALPKHTSDTALKFAQAYGLAPKYAEGADDEPATPIQKEGEPAGQTPKIASL